MSSTPRKGAGGSQDPAQTPVTQPKIMTKPLPEILDELEDYIRRVEEAVRQAQGAARDSREAAAQAKLAGEKAAEAAKKAAEAAVAQVRAEAARAAEALDNRISNLETEIKRQINTLEEKVTQEALALDTAFLTLRNEHIEESPFLKSKGKK
jgi:F0F1-type ATP synthase membrane subunit b/b'